MPWVENEDLERERRGGHCEVDKGDSASDEHVLLQQDGEGKTILNINN